MQTIEHETQQAAPTETKAVARAQDAPKKKKPSSENMAMIQAIERVALNPAADVEKLKQMLDLQERIMDRNAKMAFDTALALMQPELPEVEKLADGHNSKYAKFDKILAAIKPSLSKHGFSITHRVKIENGLILITAVLGHRDGHREETTLALPPDDSGKKSAVQAIASSTEYGRRYTMNTLLGIATKDADVDGGRAKGDQDEPELTAKAADWIALVQESVDLPQLQQNFTSGFQDLTKLKDNYGKNLLIKAKDKRKGELSNAAKD